MSRHTDKDPIVTETRFCKVACSHQAGIVWWRSDGNSTSGSRCYINSTSGSRCCTSGSRCYIIARVARGAASLVWCRQGCTSSRHPCCPVVLYVLVLIATPMLQSHLVADIWFGVGSAWSTGGGVLEDTFEMQGQVGKGTNALVCKACHRDTYVLTRVCV